MLKNLCEIFRCGWGSHYVKAWSVDLSAMQPIISFKRDGIALLSESHGVRVSQIWSFVL
jgi:hypothetical protein